jgi:hypothetical protein
VASEQIDPAVLAQLRAQPIPRDTAAVIWHLPEDADLEPFAEAAARLQEAGILVIAVQGDEFSFDVLDEDEMRAAGWVRAPGGG